MFQDSTMIEGGQLYCKALVAGIYAVHEEKTNRAVKSWEYVA